MNTILNNGASVCTPDGFAIKARTERFKRTMRNNLKAHSVKMSAKQATKEKFKNIVCFTGFLIGLVVTLGFLG